MIDNQYSVQECLGDMMSIQVLAYVNKKQDKKRGFREDDEARNELVGKKRSL